MSLFRAEVFCEKKRIGDIIERLAGLVTSDPVFRPVANAALRNGKIVAESNGTLVEQFKAHIKKDRSITHVAAPDVKAFLEYRGKTTAGASSLIANAIEAGFLKKRGKKGSKNGYDVLREKL